MYKGNSYSWNQESICMICNLKEKETLYHFLFVCPIYNNYRNFYLKRLELSNEHREALTQMCNVSDDESIKKICFYIINSLLLRAFSLNE